MKLKYLIFIIAIITYFALGKSLQFALSGDDWQALWRYITVFTSFKSYFNLHNYTTDAYNYTMANIIMGSIYTFFRFNPMPYYFFSILLRIIAAVSFYPAVYQASKSKLAGFLSAIFFSAMYTGIETTNWVFNMNTYLAIAVFNCFIFLYFNNNTFVLSKTTILQSLLLPTAFFISPTRMHGLLFIIPLLVLFKINNLKKEYPYIIVHICILYAPLFLGRFMIQGVNDANYLINLTQLANHKLDSIINLFSTIGNSLIADTTFVNLFPNPSIKASIVLSFYFLFMFFYYKMWRVYKQLAYFGFFTLLVPIAFMIVPWIINPTIILPSDHRYQIIPGSFMLVTIAIFCSILWRYNKGFYLGFVIILVSGIIISNLLTLKWYFNILGAEGRLQIDSEKQFTYLSSQIEKPNNNKPVVILINEDNSFYLYNTITFGFSYHMILIEPRFGLDLKKAPFVTDNLDSLVNVLSSEKSTELKRYGYDPVKIPLENVYAFQLQNKNMTNITPEVKKYLKERLPNL